MFDQERDQEARKVSDELDRLRAVNEAQAATLRAVRREAEALRDWPAETFTVRVIRLAGIDLLAILDGTATP